MTTPRRITNRRREPCCQQCEFCSMPALWKMSKRRRRWGTWTRYACAMHESRVERLAALDGVERPAKAFHVDGWSLRGRRLAAVSS